MSSHANDDDYALPPKLPSAKHHALVPREDQETIHAATHAKRMQQEQAARGSWQDKYKLSDIDMSMADQGFKAIHDPTDMQLEFASALSKGTLAGTAIDYIRDARGTLRTLIYGDNAARIQAGEHLAKEAAIGAATIAAGAVVGGIAKVLSPTVSRLGLLAGRGVGLGAESAEEKTVRFTELASGASKAEVLTLLRSGELNLPTEQVDKLLYTLGGGRMDSVTLKLMKNGNVRLAAERAGYSNGYQCMSFEIDQLGRTNKVVQTAFDDANRLVPQRPGEFKNNLYDVKKWNRQTY